MPFNRGRPELEGLLLTSRSGASVEAGGGESGRDGWRGGRWRRADDAATGCAPRLAAATVGGPAFQRHGELNCEAWGARQWRMAGRGEEGSESGAAPCALAMAAM